MYWVFGFIPAGAVLVGCAGARVGTQRMPVGAVNFEELALQAIRGALPADEQSCAVEVVHMAEGQQVSGSMYSQVASVRICGRSQEFAIQRKSIDADGVLITARKIE